MIKLIIYTLLLLFSPPLPLWTKRNKYFFPRPFHEHLVSYHKSTTQPHACMEHVHPLSHPEPLSSVEDLLFEPYFYLSDEVRSALREPQDPEDNVSDAFFESLARDLGMERLYLVLSAVGVSSVDIDSIRDLPDATFHRKLSRAHSFVQGMGLTYDRLRLILDSISFFKLDELDINIEK